MKPEQTHFKTKNTWVQMCDDAAHACGCVTSVASNSDVCLYVCVAREHVSVGAALGRPLWLTGGQHVGSGGCLLQGCCGAVLLQPAVYQGHKEEHHAPHHRRHASQGKGNRVVPKVIMEEAWVEGAGMEFSQFETFVDSIRLFT